MCCFHRCEKMKWNHFLKENMCSQRQSGCSGEEIFFLPLPHTTEITRASSPLPSHYHSYWLVLHSLYETQKKSFLTPQERDYVFWSHVTTFFLLSNIFYVFIFLSYLPNKCLSFASEYTNGVYQCFNNSLLYFKSLELLSTYKPFSRKSSQTHCYRLHK